MPQIILYFSDRYEICIFEKFFVQCNAGFGLKNIYSKVVMFKHLYLEYNGFYLPWLSNSIKVPLGM